MNVATQVIQADQGVVGGEELREGMPRSLRSNASAGAPRLLDDLDYARLCFGFTELVHLELQRS
jgi:hypothetical protein